VNGAVKQEERSYERHGATSPLHFDNSWRRELPERLIERYHSGNCSRIRGGCRCHCGYRVLYKVCKNTIRGDTSSPTETANVEEPQAVAMKDDENENGKKLPSEEVADTEIHDV
jgi:hypothetical protein